MAPDSIGVAVIGAGMVGRAHANAYRNAATVFGLDQPPPRLVAIADMHEPFAADAAQRYGFARTETDWRAVIDAPDIDAVSVAVANSLHREIVEAALAAGKHVLCEKPLAPSADDAQAMVDAAAAAPGQVNAVGFTFRRSPAINAIRDQVVSGGLGRVRHIVGNYWCDYGFDPQRPMSWRYQGGPGSGVLADIGSHLVDLAEFFCGETTGVQGTTMTTLIKDRAKPLGVAVGHAGGVQLSDERVPVENEDICTFTTGYADAVGTFSLSRVAFGHANTLRLDLFCENGTASFDLTRPAEFSIIDNGPAVEVNGARQVFIGPWHPYIARGLPMDFPTVGHGQNDFFVFQARAFLDQIAGVEVLPPCPDMAHGLHNLRVLEAVVSATDKPISL